MARGDDDADGLLEAAFSTDDRLAAASALARSRHRWLRQQAVESSTFAGVLLTLAESDGAVALRCGPWTHTGRLRSVTAPLCIVELAGGDVVLLPTEGITVVEASGVVADDRPLVAGPDLPAVLATLVGERPALRLLLVDGSEVAGALLGLAKDAVIVQQLTVDQLTVEQLTASVATVFLPAIAGCVLLARGTENGTPAPSRR